MELSSLVLWVEVLDMEPRVGSIESFGFGAGELVLDAPDIVRPRASVVVRSHCFASAVLGLMGVPLALPPV
jgi:hypothetical protein